MILVDFLDIDVLPDIKNIAKKAATAALKGSKSDLSIVFCKDEYIKELNSQYRKIDRPTDVLSFQSDEIDPVTGHRYLGDIIVSYQRAVAQAAEAGNPVSSEVAMLVVHGILHLLGHNHDTNEKKSKMWSAQSSILLSLGIQMDKFTGDKQ